MEKLNSIQVEKKLRKDGALLFSPTNFKRIFGASESATKNFISRHIRSGLFIKIRNGLYSLDDRRPPSFIIANTLYSPSYISFETVLSYYHIILESPDLIFSATPKSTRKFLALDTQYVYHRMHKSLFFGYETKKINDITVLIAEPEKALVDYLYFVDLKKKGLNGHLNLSSLSRSTVLKYARCFKRQSLMRLVRKVYNG